MLAAFITGALLPFVPRWAVTRMQKEMQGRVNAAGYAASPLAPLHLPTPPATCIPNRQKRLFSIDWYPCFWCGFSFIHLQIHARQPPPTLNCVVIQIMRLQFSIKFHIDPMCCNCRIRFDPNIATNRSTPQFDVKLIYISCKHWSVAPGNIFFLVLIINIWCCRRVILCDDQ